MTYQITQVMYNLIYIQTINRIYYFKNKILLRLQNMNRYRRNSSTCFATLKYILTVIYAVYYLLLCVPKALDQYII